jgi:DUF971 family protein
MGSSQPQSSATGATPLSAATKGPSVRVKSINQLDGRTLGITWTDDLSSKFDVVDLRRKCPCATCIDEWTHEQILKPESIPETTRPIKIESVGQYALTIQFNDGHRTGIYTFAMLRKLGHRHP